VSLVSVSTELPCLEREMSTLRHGHASGKKWTPTYTTWIAMVQRCRYQGHPWYKAYGGRGIQVCERWKTFENFLADMGEKPPRRSLDRIDNDGHYEPGNCRWATSKEQLRNRRGVKLTDIAAMQIRWLVGDGGFTPKEVAAAFGVTRATVSRIVAGKIWVSEENT